MSKEEVALAYLDPKKFDRVLDRYALNSFQRDQQSDQTPSGPRIVVTPQLRKRLYIGLQKMPRMERFILDLQFRYNHSPDEIGRIVGLSEEVVSAYVDRALAILRREMGINQKPILENIQEGFAKCSG